MIGATARGASFANTDLLRVVFDFAHLSGADFTGANLSTASLAGADLTGAWLTGVDLSGADVSSARLIGLVATDEAVLAPVDHLDRALRDCASGLARPCRSRRWRPKGGVIRGGAATQ